MSKDWTRMVSIPIEGARYSFMTDKNGVLSAEAKEYIRVLRKIEPQPARQEAEPHKSKSPTQ